MVPLSLAVWCRGGTPGTPRTTADFQPPLQALRYAPKAAAVKAKQAMFDKMKKARSLRLLTWILAVLGRATYI